MRAGAKVVAGGGRACPFNAGHFFEPTLLTEVTDDMQVMGQENFGPVAAIARFRTNDEALERANACDMGGSAYAFTRSPNRARRTNAELKAGMVGVNPSPWRRQKRRSAGPTFRALGAKAGLKAFATIST